MLLNPDKSGAHSIPSDLFDAVDLPSLLTHRKGITQAKSELTFSAVLNKENNLCGIVCSSQVNVNQAHLHPILQVGLSSFPKGDVLACHDHSNVV